MIHNRAMLGKAAVEPHITQAAVSQQIRQLEDALGAPLFHRHHRRISLTSTAQTYLPEVQTALIRLDKATEQHFGTAKCHNVAIHCTSSIATQWLAPHLGHFQAANPGLTLHIRTQDIANQPRADIEIFCSGKPLVAPDIIPLFDSTITPVAAPGYAPHRLGIPADILKFGLIHVVGYDDDWHRWYSTYLREGQKAPGGLSADSSQVAIDAALRGEGIHLGRQPFINKHLESGTLKQVFGPSFCLQTT